MKGLIDANGYLTVIKIGGQRVWERDTYTGTQRRWALGTQPLYVTRKYSDKGLLTEQEIIRQAGSLHKMTYSFDGATGNLKSRTGMQSGTENFTYDAFDRLTTGTSYALNGNISKKNGIGNYTYDATKKHAVVQVENSGNLIPKENVDVTYNAFNKVATVTKGSTKLTITYGTDHQRTKTVLVNGSNTTTTLYADNYEQRTANGVTTSYHYVASPDGLAAVFVKSGNTATAYYIETDHLGSIVRAYDYLGNIKFSAAYDAWGNQNVFINTIGLTRGYTGHEHWPQFGLIDMNGRFYDPLFGRFLSPDPYVQAPENPQSYNRYAYCFNNPLKYTDPSGNIAEFWAFFIFSTISNGLWQGVEASARDQSFWGGFGKGAAIGAASSAAGYGCSRLVNTVLGPATTAGQAIANVAGGFASGFVNGAGNALINHSSDPLMQGIYGGLASGAVAGVSNLLGNGRVSNDKVNLPRAELSNLELDGSILLDQVDVIAYNYHSYAKATMNIFNQIWGTNYSLVSGDWLLAKMWFHYQYGMREPVFVDATTLNLGKIRQGDIKNNIINLYEDGGINSTSLSIGHIKVQSAGDNLYSLNYDEYDFNMLKGKHLRNIATVFSGFLHKSGSSFIFGGDFDIYPVGLVNIFP